MIAVYEQDAGRCRAAEQSPLQPVKTDPASAVARNVTTVPSRYPLEHVAPQTIPFGSPSVTMPSPPPAGDTVTWYAGRNVAVIA